MIRLSRISAIVGLVAAMPLFAAPGTYHFDIKPQALATAFQQFAQQSGLQIVYYGKLAEGYKVDAIKGDLTASEALQRLVAGTGLRFEALDQRTVAISSVENPSERESSKAAEATSLTTGEAQLRVLRMAQIDSGQSQAPAAEERKDKLDEVVVQGAKRKFAPTDSNVATKLPMDIVDTPQSLSVVSSELMNIVGVSTLNKAISLTPSAVSKEGDINVFLDTVVRGFQTNHLNGNKINGMPFQNFGLNIDMGIAERFEVVRGPASIIYGQSGYGATTNTQLKSPQAKTAFFGEFGYATNGSYRAMSDLTGALTGDGRLRGRLITIYNNTETSQDHAFSRQATVAGALSYDLGEATVIDLNYFHAQRDFQNDYGFGLMQTQTGVDADGNPVFELSLPRVPRNAFLGADFGKSRQTGDFGLITVKHEFSDDWTLTAMGAVAKSTYLWDEPFAWGYIPADGNVPMYDYQYTGKASNYTGDFTLTRDFRFSGREHTLLLNAYTRSNPSVNFGGGGTMTPGTLNMLSPDPRGFTRDFQMPDQPGKLTALAPGMFFGDDNSIRENAFSGLLLLHPLERVTTMLGVRWNDYRSKSADYFNPDQYQGRPVKPYSDHAVNYRAGVVYEVLDDVNVYASYSDALIFRATKTDPAGSYAGALLPPESGVQWELGAKAALLNRKLIVATSVFKVDRENVAVSDPAALPFSGYQVAVNGQTHTGFELEAIGEPIPGWNLVASYSYLDVEMNMCARDANGACQDPFGWNGHQQANAPHNLAKLYTTYQLLGGPLRGLSFGGGMFHASKRGVDHAGTFQLPGYTQFDLRLGYDGFENVSFSLNAINITNEKIYASYDADSGGGIFYQNRRAIMFRTAFKF